MSAPAVEIPCGPAADGLDTPYWEGLRAGELRVQRCADCRAWLWGPRHICPHCHGFDLGFEPVEMTGTVYSWCRTHHPYMAEYAHLVPYVSVVVELPQADGVRLLGLLDGDSVAIGDRVTGFLERPENAAWPLLRWRIGEGA
ncbi:hypothetical protein EDD29_2828 [Actinocorallia herbida]|uniref:OB-fold protein n=1 Tax=Actinocorallia herbida TaxID=58109 RepID=A0A3N1CVI0_9ACTN|nr:zinc ribbon domain-containing protein [Actinocorallia herbida]ROO85286.1 hypothetical protein EDD29_2828 [Actinocorallia herbida]